MWRHRDWSYAATSQGSPGATKNWKLKNRYSPGTLEERQPHQHLDFKTSNLQNCQRMSSCFKAPVHGHMLGEPRKTNTCLYSPISTGNQRSLLNQKSVPGTPLFKRQIPAMAFHVPPSKDKVSPKVLADLLPIFFPTPLLLWSPPHCSPSCHSTPASSLLPQHTRDTPTIGTWPSLEVWMVILSPPSSLSLNFTFSVSPVMTKTASPSSQISLPFPAFYSGRPLITF